MSEKVDVDQEFANFSPCIYKNKIKCSDCDRCKYCDMKEGRNHKCEAFKAGWSTAIKYVVEGYVKSTTNECKVNEFSSRMCNFGTKGCIFAHD